MPIIPRNKPDKLILYDVKDHWVNEHNWYVNTSGYAAIYFEGHMYCMHREILKPRFYQIVDHINGNKLDNRRENLRLVDRKGNAWNRKAVNGTSPFKGVSWCSTHAYWLSKITHDKVSYDLGRFEDEWGAAWAYDMAAHYLFKDLAWLNFSQGGMSE